MKQHSQPYLSHCTHGRCLSRCFDEGIEVFWAKNAVNALGEEAAGLQGAASQVDDAKHLLQEGNSRYQHGICNCKVMQDLHSNPAAIRVFKAEHTVPHSARGIRASGLRVKGSALASSSTRRTPPPGYTMPTSSAAPESSARMAAMSPIAVVMLMPYGVGK